MDPTANQPAAAPQPVERLTVLKPDQQVQIGKNEYARLGPLLASRDPHCNLCTDGWVRIVSAGKAKLEVCGCCVARYRKMVAASRRARDAEIAVGVAAPGMGRQKERLDRRLGRLGAAAAKLEEEIRDREAKAAEGVASLLEESKQHGIAAQDHSATCLKGRADAERLEEEIAAAEQRLSALRLARKTALDAADADQRAVELAAALQQDIDERIARRRERLAEETRGLRKDLERAQRRLARARDYNRETMP